MATFEINIYVCGLTIQWAVVHPSSFQAPYGCFSSIYLIMY